VPPLLNVNTVPPTGWAKVMAKPPLFSVEMLPVMLAVKEVACPPVIPGGAVNVMAKLNVPLAAIGVELVANVNTPRRFVPLSEPIPNAVVPVKLGLPAKVNCGTPMTDPVVPPEIVTSAALVTLWPSAMIATTAKAIVIVLPIEINEVPMPVLLYDVHGPQESEAPVLNHSPHAPG
jgi:hypothetical protein